VPLELVVVVAELVPERARVAVPPVTVPEIPYVGGGGLPDAGLNVTICIIQAPPEDKGALAE
jgi:hypothetical protein